MSTERDILHRLFVIVYHLKKKFQEFIGEYNITEMEAKIIFSMETYQSKISDIIKRFEKHKSTITQKTRSLEEKGYVTMNYAKGDRRERVLTLTKKGKKFHTHIKDIEKKYHDDVFCKFTPQQKKEFIRLLNKIEVEHYENIC